MSLLRIPQLCRLPALTVLKPPVGASACPDQVEPQQAISVVAADPATMVVACADSLETTRRRISLPGSVGAPADDPVVAADPATMIPACADSLETTRRRISLPGSVVSPAGDGVVAADPATMAVETA